ncbi:MAG: endonuclease/exonuclease/phosphatase family protein [Candidatus Levybacteria bacterium]|nr:endonuclease/exonuclease/phosphatase family protein [Candidatus Levybacteria bacterium]
MSVKLLHLNIWYGKYLDNIISFVLEHDFDILNFQEVSGGKVSFNNANDFERLKETLHFEGVMSVTWRYATNLSCFTGNATFFKKDFLLLDKTEIWLKPYTEFEKELADHERDWREDPHSGLSLLLSHEGKQFRVINTHMAWGPEPNDEPYKLEQAKNLYEYMQKVRDPYILTGDFNLKSDSQVITWFDSLGRNLIKENSITNTLNPNIHKAAEKLFPPGLGVDYAYVSKDIKVKKCKVIDDVILSDHLALSVEFEI